MKQLNSKLRNTYTKIKVKNPYNLCFLSMQALYCLDRHTLAEEINNIYTICSVVASDNPNVSMKLCEIIYHEDDQIIEFDITFAAKAKELCSKACLDLLNHYTFPKAAECIFEANSRSEKLLTQIWRDDHEICK